MSHCYCDDIEYFGCPVHFPEEWKKNKSDKDSLEKRAEEIAKYLPNVNHEGEKPFWEMRVSRILEALKETAEEAEREAIKRCAKISDEMINGMFPSADTRSAGIRDQILKLLDPKPEEHSPECVSQVATLNRFKCNCKDPKQGE